ncbi:MAG TPA: HD domain-containing phosphohydrolase [Terracidiphilus sp.]|nr:HD domain-containing phosphohydrolase [Terracidiphilus sp.]
MASKVADISGKNLALPGLLGTPAKTGARTRRTAHILVVDDEAHVRSMIGAALEHQGYEVQLAGSGIEATEQLDRHTYDLVLTDIVMQEGSGIALLERIHTQHPQLPVVMVTAIHDISVAIDSMRRGAYDYLLKPFERDHLVATVQRALEHRHALQESKSYQQNLEQVVRARTEMLRQAMEDLEHSYDVTLEALGDALDLKDSETEGHSKRVTAYTIALARAMGISPAEIKVIARGAFLHDIGKMAIPDEILRKPGKLSSEEEQVMREHCSRGYQMLRKIPFLAEAAEIVYSHQEHFDGTGYPKGLRGTNIPIGARIFAIADALDAITSDRPYRKAQSYDVARDEIFRCAGTQFDPAIVEIFLKIPNELWQELRNEINSQNRQFSSFDIEPPPRLPAA